MRGHSWFRMGLICLCLIPAYLEIGRVSAQEEVVLNVVELPQNAALLRHGDPALTSLLNEVDEERLMGHVVALESFKSRHVNSPKNMPDQGIGAAYRYILNEFETIAAQSGNMEVSSQEFIINYAGSSPHLQNIIAVIPGTDPTLGAIVIGAHYDSISINPSDGLAYAPGANDNASGTAALIELGRILSAHPHRATIILVAFSAEEVGRVGSRLFVRDYIQLRQIDVDLMINVDMIGGSTGSDGSSNDGSIRLFSEGPDDSPSRKVARTFDLVADHYVLDMEIVVQDRADRVGRYGDQMSFTEQGIPAVRFIEEQEHPEHQHCGFDTFDNIQPSYLRRSTQTILASVIVLADGLLAPSSVHLDDNGNGGHTLSWEPVPGATSYVIALRSPNSLVFDQQLEVQGTSLEWSDLDSGAFGTLAIAAKDENGLIGPLSTDLSIS